MYNSAEWTIEILERYLLSADIVDHNGGLILKKVKDQRSMNQPLHWAAVGRPLRLFSTPHRSPTLAPPFPVGSGTCNIVGWFTLAVKTTVSLNISLNCFSRKINIPSSVKILHSNSFKIFDSAHRNRYMILLLYLGWCISVLAMEGAGRGRRR